MRIFTLYFCLTAFFALWSAAVGAQVTLLSEDFDNCTLSSGWSVQINGNQNAVWYVTDSILNDDNNGQSMNGSCFFFIDDDASGNNTPAFVLNLVSPAFDASQFPKLEFNADIHYRDWPEGNEFFEVWVSDGVNEHLITRFDQNRSTGNNLNQFVRVSYDLALLTQSPNARLIFRYNDAGAFNWWAGIDNISIVGSGEGENVLKETFNDCTMPAGWETEIVTGEHGWKFGIVDTGAANGSSMDGTCFAYFDDDIIGSDAAYSTVRLKSPWFNGAEFANFNLFFDVIVRYVAEKVAVYVAHEDGSEYLVGETNGDVGGPGFSNYVNMALDLSPYRSQQMRVIFEYDDGKEWGWWAGLDNVKITGSGTANDLCVQALPLYTGMNCLPANTLNALFDGPPAACVERSAGALWYRWTADVNGSVRVRTSAQFNDVVNVFTGDCVNPTQVVCDNDDEHGFTGETTFFTAQAGVTYLIRVSGREGGFGAPRGQFCVDIAAQTPPAPPANDACEQAIALSVNQPPIAPVVNQHARMSATSPSLNELARADIWFSFVAPTLAPGAYLEIQSNANFSDIITAYTGGCSNLTEVAGNHHGRRLALENTVAGQTYWVQIAGTFSTVEGAVSPQIVTKTQNSPPNDLCATAILLAPGADCVSGTTQYAAESGLKPACVPQIGPDVWYRFVAPASGSVRIQTGADFQHILAIWTGGCNQLENIACFINPLRCDGAVQVSPLVPGNTYWIQIANRAGLSAPESGVFCLKLTDGAVSAEVPLALKVIEKCVAENITQLQISATGGLAPYQFSGNQPDELLNAGESYLVVLEDAAGCVRSLTGTAKPCQSAGCSLTGSLAATDPTCYDASNGAISPVAGGGVGPYTYNWSTGATSPTLSGLAAGVYAVTMTDALGCELVLSTSLTAPTPLLAVPSSTVQPTLDQSNGAIYVEVSGGNGPYQYQWTLDGQAFISTEDLTNAPAGEYQLQITDANQCTAVFEFSLQAVVSATEVTEAAFIEVFPNPAKEKAWVAVAFGGHRTVHLSIVDANGRVLRTWTHRKVSEQNLPLDLKQLPAGVYQVVIRTEKELVTEPLIIQK